MIKFLSIRTTHFDADALGSLYVKLSNLPYTVASRSKDRTLLLIMCREEMVPTIRKVVSEYVQEV